MPPAVHLGLTLELAVAKVGKYATNESGDTVEVVERPHGGLSVVIVDGQRSGKSAKAISNIVARKAEKREPDANPYMQKFLRQTAWQPKGLAVFAGKLDYPRYRFVDRQLIRLIMLMTKGPTDPKAVIEFTDWQQVEAFGRRVSEVPA